ncbi:MAG TPA: NB-ARC domain-containing protein, partial [Ktedonobacteraceae bacterium]|nr:NB-ARC domain-containing protein [Ktedonobacteraceae bacterium]
MSGEVSKETFLGGVQHYLRMSGYSQKDLADELHLNHKVLSRKLHGNRAYLTHMEVKHIILALALWKAITRRSEVLELLRLAEAGPNTFSTSEWQTPPLNELTDELDEPAPPANPVLRNLPLLHNLPTQITPLIGRKWAVEHLRKLLLREDIRLVTLVGSGGCGKTRLAQYIACALLNTFPDGVWFVALGGVSDPELIPMSIMQVLNIQPAANASPLQSLTAYLQDKRLLLLLDNFEQVAAGAPVVSELLEAAPGLKVMVTSRMVLHLYGERDFNVPPLDLPDFGVALEPHLLMRYGAIQLFIERAQAVDPHFSLTAENALSIAQICARVDGLPLALELAAARVKVLSPNLLSELLSRARLPVLTGGAINLPNRQQTLRNTIIWSYDLLSASEKLWFCRLGVFNDGWSLEAVEALMRDLPTGDEYTLTPVSAMTMLEHLVNNSLLVRQPAINGQIRFTMLETLREYALERLTEQGEIERLRDWHSSYYLNMAEAGEIGLKGPRQLEWLKLLALERDNFQAAMEWSMDKARAGKKIFSLASAEFRFSSEGKATDGSKRETPDTSPVREMFAIELCLRLASALRPYWEWRGYLDESRTRLKAALEIPWQDNFDKSVLAARAKALSEMSRLICLQNDQPRAVKLAEESVALWEQVDDAHGLAVALLHRGWPAFALGEFDVAERVFTRGLHLLAESNDVWLRAELLFYLGSVAGFSYQFDQMRLFYAQSLTLFEQV